MADVSAAADPNTGGLSVYAPTSRKALSWSQYGGTSESAPIIASVYALAGGGYSNATPYAHPGSLFDITSGSNGTCPTTQWCNARAGWDGPTGLGYAERHRGVLTDTPGTRGRGRPCGRPLPSLSGGSSGAAR